MHKSIFIAILFISGCSDNSTYTLYRNSVINEAMRIHVASFDTKDGNDYNSGNCQIAQELFQNQDGVTVKYWCEKGNFKR
jgi:hypothetical protein